VKRAVSIKFLLVEFSFGVRDRTTTAEGAVPGSLVCDHLDGSLRSLCRWGLVRGVIGRWAPPAGVGVQEMDRSDLYQGDRWVGLEKSHLNVPDAIQRREACIPHRLNSARSKRLDRE
jgi:hypothetical protein